jgi:hypothetical protein
MARLLSIQKRVILFLVSTVLLASQMVRIKSSRPGSQKGFFVTLPCASGNKQKALQRSALELNTSFPYLHLHRFSIGSIAVSLLPGAFFPDGSSPSALTPERSTEAGFLFQSCSPQIDTCETHPAPEG